MIPNDFHSIKSQAVALHRKFYSLRKIFQSCGDRKSLELAQETQALLAKTEDRWIDALVVELSR